ncbi:hypothetical protein [Microcoleus sp. A2-C2]
MKLILPQAHQLACILNNQQFWRLMFKWAIGLNQKIGMTRRPFMSI